MSLLRKISSIPKAVWFLMASLLLVDGVLIVCEMLHHLNTTRGIFPAFSDAQWKADFDNSYAETWSYIQVVGAVIGFLWLWRTVPRSPVFFLAALLFLAVVVDDAKQIHEIYGGTLANENNFGPAFGLRGQDLGELIIWGAIFIPLLACLLISYVLSSRTARSIVIKLIAPVLIFGGLALVLDMSGPASAQWGISTRQRYFLELCEVSCELPPFSVLLGMVTHYVLKHRTRSASLSPAPKH